MGKEAGNGWGEWPVGQKRGKQCPRTEAQHQNNAADQMATATEL